ncbi:unnamed protein product [Arabis nemorensis]|uniref:Uncharacterized protein n=1 Tax=Arabis nemorensis TaxID=586526 RepID=A0A565CV82_9BRAS|nr:unnamed protein product [Arabis nemorensis]
MDLAKKVAKSLGAGLIAVPVILIQFGGKDPVMNPMMAFLVGAIARGVLQFISKAIDNGDFGIIEHDVHVGTILGSAVCVYVMFLLIALATMMNPNLEGEEAKVLGTFAVTIVCNSVLL